MVTAGTSDESFRIRFEPHRRPITRHCYRMLGSLQDAEELTQEVLLRAWERQDDVRSLSATRSWLYQIATNACLDQLAKIRRRRTLPQLAAPSSTTLQLGPATEAWAWVEPAPDTLLDLEDGTGQRPDEQISSRESIGLAFIAALQFLSPKQRAALLLVDVLGWKPHEAAAVLQTSVVSVNSLLQRARSSVDARRQGLASPTEVPSSDEALLRRFINTWETGDLDAFATLLTDDALFSMPPQPEWFTGREAIRRFFAFAWSVVPGERRLLPLRANGGPAVAIYNRPPGPNTVFQASAITLLTFRSERVSQMTRFALPKLFARFGLPSELPWGSLGGRASSVGR
jgi:RNA polymerase sigma-70 factor, ECF subfamily